MLPIVLKMEKSIDRNINDLSTIPVWGQRSQNSTPLGQITQEIEVRWEDELVRRFNGKRAMKAQCDASQGILPGELQTAVKEKIDNISLPDGYSIRWDGTVGSASEAQSALFLYLPLAVGLMLIIIIGLFNNLKQPIIIFLIVPFAFVGIVFGFITTGQTLSFIGIIGALGLIGMMIKNSVVLLDEINIGIRSGKTALISTIDASVSRMRPVMLASLTTILGMFPLLWDVMFNSLAITILFGLLVGSLITLLFVPVMYTVFYRVDVKELKTKRISNKL
jgi:multidrug efflux pump subunit AcrB